jgi:hypothetical protein
MQEDRKLEFRSNMLILLLQSIAAAPSAAAPPTPSLPQWVLITKELLPAIGSLWQVLLILLLGTFLALYRKQIKSILAGRFKFKGAGAEIDVRPTVEASTVIDNGGQAEEAAETQTKLLENTVPGTVISEEPPEETKQEEPLTIMGWRFKMYSSFRDGSEVAGTQAFEMVKKLSEPMSASRWDTPASSSR